jgi:S-DNA-T family DNA segregation ATPase FtsK/SpoIIIE
MKVKLTLMRSGGSQVDLTVTAEPTTTIGEIARRVQISDPEGPGGGAAGDVTLRVQDAAGSGAVLDPALTLDDAALASGAILSVASAGKAGTRETASAGTVRVIEGPDAGKTYALPLGHSALGRDSSHRVSLTDPLVSKLHLRVNITDHVEIIDAGSSNGTLVNGEPIDRATLVEGDLVTVGDTVLTISALAQAAATDVGGIIHFNRSPRLDPQYAGTKVVAPETPEKPRPSRLPYIAMLAPLVVGGVFLLVNPGNPFSVLFIALSPLLMIATFVDNLIQSKRQWKLLVKEFRASVEAMEHEIDELHEEERQGRRREAPSVAEVVAECSAYRQLLWTRRDEHASFLALRLGLGALPSRHEFEIPGQRKGPADLWALVRGLQARLALVDATPAVENLAQSGGIGVAGHLDLARSVARGLVAQLAGLHSPAELTIAAVASSTSARDWDWLKWLPHVDGSGSPLASPSLATGGPGATALIAELEELIAVRQEAARDQSAEVRLPIVVLVVEDDAPVERARLVSLAEAGPQVGIHLLWVAPSINRVPAACRTFVDVGAAADQSLAGYVHTGIGVEPIECEGLTLDEARTFARTLAPVVDAGARVEDASDLPRSVSFLQIVGPELGSDHEAVLDRWRETKSILTGSHASLPGPKSRPNLRAVFGQGSAEPFALDLRNDGPHALVGGTTGSGKSEFLQAWILGLAATHSPQRIAFLFVDYKGGAAFAECVRLPHTVGLVTDLSPHLVRRALTSLRAELRYREHLFNRKKVKDIVEFERTGDPEVPPSLVIVVDEFAALATEVPEFVDGVVDVAQRGRSLGLHLILATQRPAGVIRDNLRANTNLRVALRMADEADSVDVLGVPMAASFDPAVPGRAAAKTGPGRIKVFQSGYAGGWTSDVPEASEIMIEELRFGASASWAAPNDPEEEARRAQASQGPNDIARIVRTVGKAATTASIPEPRRPWLPELAHSYDFSKLPNRRTDAELVIGVVDDAAAQAQPTVSYLPDRDGNMAVIGTGGSGKSTTLRTLAVASAITMRGGPVQVYGLDFAAGGLQMLEGLPHVGSIVSGDDEERVARLLRWLRDLVDDRAVRFAEARAGNIVDYRKIAERPDEPRILLLLDGMGAFRETYESSVASPWFSVFSQIATDGRQVGVHVIVTGDRAGSIPTSLSSSIQRRLVLRLANPDDYAMLGVDADVLTPMSPPGRGLLDGLETQVAVLGGDPNVAVQARELEALAEAASKAGLAAAKPIERLSDSIPLESLPQRSALKVTIGIADDDLKPVAIDPSGAFVIAGPPGSGRSTALAAIAAGLRSAKGDAVRLFLLSPRRSPLTTWKGWTKAADSPDAVEALLGELGKAVDAGTTPGAVALFVENLADFSGHSGEFELERIVKALLKQEQFVVAETETSTWSQVYSLGQPLRAARRGLLLQPDDGDGDLLLNTPIGRVRRGTFPPGRGFLIGQGRARKVQVAFAADGA